MTIALAIAAVAAVVTFAGIAVRLGLTLGALRGEHRVTARELEGMAREYAAYRIAAERQVGELRKLADDVVAALGEAGDPRIVAAALSVRDRATLEGARERAAELFAGRAAAAASGIADGLRARGGLLGRIGRGARRSAPRENSRVDDAGRNLPGG